MKIKYWWAKLASNSYIYLLICNPNFTKNYIYHNLARDMESRTNRKSVSFRETIDSQVIEQETTISSTHSNLPHQHLYQYETNSGLNTIESIQNLTLEQDANFTIQQMLAAKNINIHHISGKLNREAQFRSRKLKILVVKAVIILFSIFSSCIFAFTLALAFRVNAHLLYESK